MISDFSWTWVSVIKIRCCTVNHQSDRLRFQISFSETLSSLSWICRSLYFASVATSYWSTQTCPQPMTMQTAVLCSDQLFSSQNQNIPAGWVMWMWPDLWYRERVTVLVSRRKGEGATYVYTDNVPGLVSCDPWCEVTTLLSAEAETETARGPHKWWSALYSLIVSGVTRVTLHITCH